MWTEAKTVSEREESLGIAVRMVPRWDIGSSR
jgi:hypothetical protein